MNKEEGTERTKMKVYKVILRPVFNMGVEQDRCNGNVEFQTSQKNLKEGRDWKQLDTGRA